MLAEERILVDFLLNSDEKKINRKETLLLYYLQVIYFICSLHIYTFSC
jgi:hypothetical protein